MPLDTTDCRILIVDTIPARLACYDTDRKIMWINTYSAMLLGKSPQQLIGKTCCEVWQNCTQPFLDCHIIRALNTGEPQKAEIKTAQDRIWSLKASPQKNEKGNIQFVCEYGHDITERVKLKELEDDINAITRHDLKSPAIAALNTVRLIKDDDNLNQDQRELLDELEKNGKHMLEIINHTLNHQKIERGDYVPDIKKVNALEILKDVRSSFNYETEQKKLSFTILLNGKFAENDSKFFIDAEENLLHTALINIVKNAIEASPPRSNVTIEASDEVNKKINIRNQACPVKIASVFV